MAKNKNHNKVRVSTIGLLKQWFREKIHQVQHRSSFATVSNPKLVRSNLAHSESAYLYSSGYKARSNGENLYDDGVLTLLKKLSKGTFNFVNPKKENQTQPDVGPVAIPTPHSAVKGCTCSECLTHKKSDLWQETEKLLKVGSWEYDVKAQKFFCTNNTYSLLSATQEAEATDFLSLLPFFAKSDREGLMENWNNALLLGEEAETVARLSHTSEAAWVKLIFKPVIEKNKVVRVIGTLEDVTACVTKENKLLFEKKKAEEVAHMKTEIMSLFSHEVRTPLNSIVGLTYLLLQEDNIAPEQRKHLNSIHFSTQNLLSLSNNTLDYSKIEAGRLELEVVNFKLKDLLQNLYQSFYARALEKHINLELKIDSNIPEEIAGDPIRLTQVLNNLVSNAIKFTKEGSVKLSVEAVYQSDNDCILDFSVEDTGIGIPEDCQQLIFESYVQANTSTHRKFGGTGLGLAITKKIVELHKGEIKVTSSYGTGSAFNVRLKYAKAKPSASKSAFSNAVPCKDTQTTASLEGLKVLVIDDDTINNLVSSELLMKWGAKVDTAENGMSALEKVGCQSYDLILMDLYMPTMDGFETITQIRQAGLQTPVIALTGTANKDEIQKLLAMGVNDYLIKPFNPQQLYHKIISTTVEPSI